MQLIYTHENSLLVENAKNCLAQAGIACEIKNLFEAGGVGELSPIEVWPELWVHERDVSAAKGIVAALVSSDALPDWICKVCGESNAAAFEYCWHCQAER